MPNLCHVFGQSRRASAQLMGSRLTGLPGSESLGMTKAFGRDFQLQRLLENASKIKGTVTLVYGFEIGCGTKDSMDFPTPPASGVKVESEVIHQQQNSAGYKQPNHSLPNRL